MNGEALVKLALKNTSYTQKKLAEHLGVSPTQISKWKNGEYVSGEMEQKLRTLAKVGDKDPSFVMWSGSLENAVKWERIILLLANNALNNSETGYITYPLSNEDGMLCWDIFETLNTMGVEIPHTFPSELEFINSNDEIEFEEETWLVLEEHPITALISDIFHATNDVYGFYTAYIDDLLNDEQLELKDTVAVNIEPCLIELAATKIEPPSVTLAPRYSAFRARVRNDYEGWLNVVKDRAFRAGVPLKAELLDLVYCSEDELSVSAERESLGFNANRIHPDIYMNELLVGMRLIHQVLPTILDKLGIDFTVDDSSLSLKDSTQKS